jgi:preprotein translocase subunit SecD
MKNCFARFNVFLLIIAMAVGAGCKSSQEKKEAKTDEKAEKKPMSTLQLHMEINPDGSDRNGPVSVYRDNPTVINVWRAPFLDQAHILEASVIDQFGSFAIKIRFDPYVGQRLFEQATSNYRGQRIAIFSQFGEARWLAAPKVTKTISDGVLIFTPDATREEADRIVLGLNNFIKELKKKS